MASRGAHIVRYEQFLPRPRAEVFAFFAAAENLERITPPELQFRILTRLPVGMSAGKLIEYRLGLFGVPFTWRTRINEWQPPHMFVDEQLNGPYREWVHTHTFTAVPGGTIVRDEVRYRLPLFPAGEVAWPVVRLQIERIFRYRRRCLEELLGTTAETPKR
ncbi:MAG: SRPBCC family protein [Gemmatimonadetes bacterium]|nr:SRPBCC family protein [Gemmatimonadota bacterium]